MSDRKIRFSIPFSTMILVLFWGCFNGINNKTEGKRSASKDIAEAKKHGFYIQSYRILENSIDSLNIKEAFIEKGFGRGKTYEETIPLSINYPFEKYQFNLKIEDGMLNAYYDKFYLKLLPNQKGFNVDYSLSCFIDSIEIQDTMRVCVLKERNNDWTQIDTIGILTFVKSDN